MLDAPRSTSTTSSRGLRRAARAPRRRSRSPIRPPRARRRGRPARRCCCCSCCSACSPDRGRHALESVAPPELPSWAGTIRLSGVRAFDRVWDVRLEDGQRARGGRAMKIASSRPPWFPVPPTGYGGIEWVVSLLADGLATPATTSRSSRPATRARRRSSPPSSQRRRASEIGRTFSELHHALPCFARADEFDVINDHTGMLGRRPRRDASTTPVVHTVHGPLDGEPGEIYEQIAARRARTSGLISISMNQRKPQPEPELDRELPQRARLLRLPVQAAPRRLPALPRPHEPGQGLRTVPSRSRWRRGCR